MVGRGADDVAGTLAENDGKVKARRPCYTSFVFQLTPSKFLIILLVAMSAVTGMILWLSTYEVPVGALTATDRKVMAFAVKNYYSPEMVVKRCGLKLYRIEPRNETDAPLFFIDDTGKQLFPPPDGQLLTVKQLWYELRPCTQNLLPLTK